MARLGHAVDDGDGTTTVTNFTRGRWARGDELRLAGVVSSSPVVKIFNPATLSNYPEYKVNRRSHESRRQSVAGGKVAALASWSISATVLSGSLFSRPDRAPWSTFFSQISMATSPSLCIKLVVLHTSYKSTIGIKLIWALDQGQTDSQTWVQVTAYLKFRLNQPDSLTSSLLISNIFLTTMLTLLSKVVLL
jgi:hypothetical protein